MSVPAPVRHPDQPIHEVVFALLLRDDGKIWSGRVSFTTASKPMEAEILHLYKPPQPIDTLHGEPYPVVLPGNRSIDISHLRDVVDVPVEINGTGISSGSFEFAGNGQCNPGCRTCLLNRTVMTSYLLHPIIRLGGGIDLPSNESSTQWPLLQQEKGNRSKRVSDISLVTNQ